MKERDFDHLEGQENNQRLQILAFGGTQGQGTRAGSACEHSGHSTIG